MVEVPGPEPDWEHAAAYQGGKRNPALQGSIWEYAVGGFRLVAGLGPSLESLAARLRLHTERSWEDGLVRQPDFVIFMFVRVFGDGWSGRGAGGLAARRTSAGGAGCCGSGWRCS